VKEKEARGIFIKGPSFKLENGKPYSLQEIITLSTSMWKEFHEANGYLKAIEKTKGLEKTLNEIYDITASIRNGPIITYKEQSKLVHKKTWETISSEANL